MRERVYHPIREYIDWETEKNVSMGARLLTKNTVVMLNRGETIIFQL